MPTTVDFLCTHMLALRKSLATQRGADADPAAVTVLGELLKQAKRLRPDAKMLSLIVLPHGPVPAATLDLLGEQIVIALRSRKPR